MKLPKWVFPLIVSLSLGLAPFFPEPHIFGKLKWLFGGGEGMLAKDFFDLVLHGFPWIWLIYVIIGEIRKKK